jgi:L-iditol 2-dehydrogenase
MRWKVMKAAVFLRKGKMEIQEREIPTPASGEVLVKVKACGICGTDQHIFHGHPGSTDVVTPIVLGHELSGEVVSIGDGVQTLKLGDRVTIDPNIYCRTCEYCRQGRQHLCDNLEAIGVTRDGGMAEYVTVPAENCYVLPDSLSYEEGAMVEPLGCVIHGIEQIKIWPGASVCIIGGGFIGQIMLQMVKMYGASPVLVSEPDESKHQTLLDFQADFVINPLKKDLKQTIAGGVDIVIECVGRQETMEQAVALAKKGGQILFFGVSSPHDKIQVSPYEVFSKELTIRGSFINPNTHPMAISLIEKGKVRIQPLISHYFTLQEIPDIMPKYREMKVTKGILRFE